MKNTFGNGETILKAGNDRIWSSKGCLPISIVLEYHLSETAEESNASLQPPQAFSFPSAVFEIVLRPVVAISRTHEYEI
jgi:hypothetical protein